MLFLLLSLLFAGDIDQPIWIYETNIHQPFFLDTRERLIAVSEQGEVFFIDSFNPKMTMVDASGRTVGVIASEGLGPGELIQPTHIEIHGGQVFVKDTGKNCISIWKTDGSFVKQVKTKGRNFGMSLCTASQGFVLADWDFSINPDKPIEATYFNTLTGTQKVVWHTKRHAATGGSVTRMSKVPKVKFNPATDNYFLASSKDGKTIFISEPGENLTIHVVDIASGKILKTIVESVNPIPYNTAWGNNQLRLWKEYTDSLSDAPKGLSVEADFTEFFPVVRGLFLAADGNLVVSRWMGRPGKMRSCLVFNDKGQQTESVFSDWALSRVFAVVGDIVYVTTYDNNKEEAGFATMPGSKVSEFVKMNPIQYDGHLPYDVYMVR